MENRVYNKGEIIFRSGDAADCMFDIRWGRVGIFANYGTARQKQLAVLEGGEFFGEAGMIDRAPRSADAVALENGTSLTPITEDQLGALFQEKPAKVLMIMQQLSGHLRRLTRNYMDACAAAAGVAALEESGAADPAAEQEAQAKAEHYAQEGQDPFYAGA